MRQPETHSDAARWAAVDAYFADHLLPDDPALAATLRANADAGLPAIDVSALQGQLLGLLTAISNARRVLEVGTLGGFSTIHIARALPPGGTVTTIEIEPHHAETAARNFAAAGVADRVEQHIGRAADVLATLTGAFDLVFIDADKPSNPTYLREALRLSRPGTVIVVDNVVRRGKVIENASQDANVQGVRAMMDLIAAEPRLSGTAVQTVGEKGWDGLVLLRVSDQPLGGE